jgi:ABC-2 type transport system ATP-binding protein
MMPDIAQTGQVAGELLPQAEVPAVMLEQVSKWYGNIIGMNDISLAISGGVTGLLGPNGAGKSTLFKILAGKLKPSQGTVRLFGIDPWKNTAPFARIGYVSENDALYDWMTALEFVTTLARLYGYTRDEARVKAERVLEFVDLKDVMHKEIGKFSKGMRQRVKIAHALVNDPELIILDEPLQGCDPLARTTIMNVIRELGAMGRTVIISSHILEEIERITEQIVILNHGRLLALGNVHAIRDMLDAHPHSIALSTDRPRELGKAFLDHKEVFGVHFPEEGKLIIRTHNLGALHADLPQLITDSGFSVTAIDNPDDNLESILTYLTGGGD